MKNVIGWTLQGVLALQYLLSGKDKFTGAEAWERRFDGWGYPDGFFYLIGALELIAAVLIVVPRAAVYGAGLIIVLMTGATITHLRAGDGHFYGALIPLILAAVVLVLRWSARARTIR